MTANVNPETGIAYGVVALNSLQDWVCDEFFNNGRNLSAEAAEDGYRQENAIADSDDTPQEFYDNYEECEDVYSLDLDDEGIHAQLSWLGGTPLVFVFQSPIIATARPCSPCVPNAGDLDSKDETGIKCYDLPSEWWGDAA